MESVKNEATDTQYAIKMEMTQNKKNVTIGKLGRFVLYKKCRVIVSIAEAIGNLKGDRQNHGTVTKH